MKVYTENQRENEERIKDIKEIFINSYMLAAADAEYILFIISEN